MKLLNLADHFTLNLSTSTMNRFWEVGKKIVAIGRNYAEHAKELNNPLPKKPILFLKPTTSYIRPGQSIEIPPAVRSLHHEVELGVIIGKKAVQISPQDAMEHVAGYTLALDMTARDLQDEAKSKGLPWTEAKGHDTFCPVSDFIEKNKIADPHNIELWLKVDNQFKQKGNTKDMIFKLPEMISYISHVMTLEPGDVILTGTPSGVGPVAAGSVITCGITGVIDMKFPVIARKSKL